MPRGVRGRVSVLSQHKAKGMMDLAYSHANEESAEQSEGPIVSPSETIPRILRGPHGLEERYSIGMFLEAGLDGGLFRSSLA